MIVDAEVWHWTQNGMRRGEFPTLTAGYIQVRDAERLLAEAHERGRVAGLKSARDLVIGRPVSA
jgi:hypothetical protein